MTPAVMPPASRSNSSPALPVHLGSGLGHSIAGLPGAGFGIDQLPSEDMVAAAHTLLSNNHHGTRHASFNYGPQLQLAQQHLDLAEFVSSGPSRPGPNVASAPPMLLATVGHSNGPQLRTARLPSSSSATSIHMDTDLATVQPGGLVFPNNTNTTQQDAQQATQQATLPSATAPLNRQSLQWGTDESFAQKQFTPRSRKETSEALMSIHLKSMECLAPNHSTGLTRPSSPTYDAAIAPLNLKTRTGSFVTEAQTNGKSVMPPRKRRKGKAAQGEDSETLLDDDGSAAANGLAINGDEEGASLSKNGKPRKRKAKAVSNDHQPPSQSPQSPESSSQNANGTGSDAAGGSGPAPTKRRRSAAVVKPPRENLTEEQKRENHIKSEQKRRTLIKTGFDDLCILVPGLQGGNMSKSLVLTTATSWLTELLEGNKRLQSQLNSMKDAAYSA